MKISDLLSIVFALCISLSSHAQIVLKRGDTTYDKWKNAIVYLESAYNTGPSFLTKDTLTGTAFLINDSEKFYLVTAKHLIKNTLYGKNEKLANDSVFIKANLRSANEGGMNIKDLLNKDAHKSPVFFAADNADIGIISLQKDEHKKVLTYLLNQGCKPISIEFIDAESTHLPDEFVLMSAYSIFKGGSSRKIKAVGLSIGQITSYEKNLPFFTMKLGVHQGNNGAPVIADNKLIGMVSNEVGVLTNADIIAYPFSTSTSATVTKASYIIACLRKLQQVENNSDFNK